MDNIFEIKKCYIGIIVKKNGTCFGVEKGRDGDIWFDSLNNIEIPICLYTSNQEEWQSYFIFENLMKAIVGRYVLSGDFKNEYNFLPKDFIDLESKTITWHSDSNHDNILQLKFREKEIILSIFRDKKTSDRNSNNSIKVRIRTSGSDYEYYYQEFEKFYSELESIAYQNESSKKQNISMSDKTSPTKRLSLFNIFKK